MAIAPYRGMCQVKNSCPASVLFNATVGIVMVVCMSTFIVAVFPKLIRLVLSYLVKNSLHFLVL